MDKCEPWIRKMISRYSISEISIQKNALLEQPKHCAESLGSFKRPKVEDDHCYPQKIRERFLYYINKNDCFFSTEKNKLRKMIVSIKFMHISSKPHHNNMLFYKNNWSSGPSERILETHIWPHSISSTTDLIYKLNYIFFA